MFRSLIMSTCCFFLFCLVTPGQAAPLTYPVQVSVMATETNQPVAGVSVEFHDANRKDQPVAGHLVTQSDGSGVIQLPKGFYRYLMKAEGYGLSNGYVSAGGAENNVLKSWLNKAASLQGRLVNGDGQPLSGMKLLVGAFFQVTTDATGQFMVDGLDSRGQDITLQQPGWVLEKPSYIQLSPGKKKELGDLCVRRSASVTVALSLVKNSYLAKPTGISVNLSGQSDWRNEKVSANGTVKLDGLPPGRYTIAISDERMEGTETVLQLDEGEHRRVALVSTPRPPSLEIEETGDVFLPERPLKMRIHGLWVNRAEANILRIPLQRVIDGSLQLANPEKIDAKALTSAKNLTIQLKKSKNSARTRGHFTLPPLAPGPYLLVLEGDGAVTRIAFLVTRLGLVAKVAPSETLLYTVDLITGKPLADVTLHGKNNITNTGSDGTASWQPQQHGTLITGIFKNNLALLTLSDASSEENKESDIKGYLYTERTVYRPGQEVFFKGVFRQTSGDNYRLPPSDPIQIKVTDSGDKTVHEATLTPQSSGSFHGSFSLSTLPGLGQYNISASQGTAKWHSDFKVQEYRKPEFEVKLQKPEQFHLSGSTVSLHLAANYYFGSPVAGGRVAWRVYSEPYESNQDSGNGFNEKNQYFGGYSDFIAEGEAVLDQKGEAIITVPVKNHDIPTVYQIEADVTDLSSRQASGSTGFTVVPSLVKIRIKGEHYLLAPGQKGSFFLRVSDWQDNPRSSTPVSMLVEHQQYDKKSRSYTWKQTDRLHGITAEDGAVRLDYTFPANGFWRLRGETRDTENRLSFSDSYAWVWKEGGAFEGSYRELEAELDKQSYKPGETAKLILRTPATGASLLLTLEGRRIHQRRIIPLDSAVQVIEIPVTAELAPNIHISAIVVHGGRFYQQNGLLKVDLEPGRLGVRVTPQQKVYAPGDKAVLKIETTSSDKPVPAELSLAVVDEAIYAVAPETQEDIYRFFRGRRDHLISTLHSFTRVYLGGASKDKALAAMEDELNGVKVRKLFKDTAGWFPLLTSTENGSTTAELTLPDNLTTWRATAIGHTTDHNFGSGQTTFMTRLPFMARISPPRFMIAGDSLQIPGLLNDTSGTDQQVSGRFDVQGLSLLGENSFKDKLAAGGSLRRNFTVQALAPGTAVLTFSAKGDAGSDALELALPVLPQALKRELTSGLDLHQQRGETTLLLPDNALANSGFITTNFSPTLTDSLIPALEKLALFPYGCVEQTLSRFVPAVHLRNILKQHNRSLSPELEQKLPLLVAEGVRRLTEMQQEDGGWGWWKHGPARAELTAVAMHGLATLKQAGVELDQEMINRGIEAMQKQLADSSPLVTAQLYQALTAHGIRNDALEKRLIADAVQLSPQARIALAGALANNGNRNGALKLLETVKQIVQQEGEVAFVPVSNDHWYWGNSSLELSAHLLSVLTRITPNDPLTSALARYLSRQQGGGWWRTTTVSSSAVIALGDYLAGSKELDSSYTVRLLHNGTEKEQYQVLNGDLTAGKKILTLPAAKGENKITLVPDTSASSGHLDVSLNWLAPTKATVEAEGIKLTRQAYRIKSVRDGEQWRHEYLPLSDKEPVTVGEDIELRLVVENRKPLEYLILENPLPAGFEPRRTDSDPRYAEVSWYRAWYEQLEQRDRLTAWFIGRLPAGRHEFRSVITPELQGTVTALPAAIWPMYQPELRSESAAWEITVGK